MSTIDNLTLNPIQTFGNQSLNCPFCSSTNSKKQHGVAGFLFLYCNHCKSVFRSDAHVVVAFEYPEEYYGDAEKEKFWFAPIVWMLNSERRSRTRYIAKRIPLANTSVIDIGCGNGALLTRIQQKTNCNAIGIEMDSVAARRASKNTKLSIISKPFQEVDLPLHSFDAVVTIHSFEHIAQPQQNLEKASRLVKTDGMLYIAIPNIASFQYKLFGRYWLHLDPEFHLHFIHPDFIKSTMLSKGFMFRKARHFNPVQNIPGFVLSALNLVTGKRDVLFDMLRNRKKLRNPFNVLLFLLLLILSAVLLPIAITEELVSVALGRGATVDFVFSKNKPV
ncbi:MAG: hypothetical protein CVU11_12255 [Bacteroidetes bacterium HGW-Bacteroidetes-6]|nr:MAG: hypothetical protein CVU11_12255 [Bacteroidetes bacterium HGW-Bacteroidetes-6]